MATTRIPLVGSPSNRDATVGYDQRFVNAYPELITNPATGSQHIYLNKRFGLVKTSNPSGLSSVEGRGIFASNGHIYSVFGNKLYSDSTVIQTLTTSTGAVGFTETVNASNYLFFCDGTDGYVISLTNVVTKITSANFPTPHVPTPVFMDGYVFLQKSTGEIFNCNNLDPLTWDATAFITPENYPDGDVGLARQNNQVVSMGTDSVEFFYDAANATGSPLAPTSQAVIQFGCSSIGSVAQEEGLIVFVAQSVTGGKFVVAVEGFQPNNISNPAIERILNDQGNAIRDCWAYLCRVKGHFFYVLNLPSTARTLVYDLTTKMWHEWTFNNSIFLMADKTEYADTLYFQHETNGNIYKADPTVYMDDIYPINVNIQTSRFDGDSAKVKYMSRLEIIADHSPVTSLLSIYWSDDDYKTFSTARTVDLADRAKLYRCGSFRRRAFLFVHTANAPLRMEAMEFEVTLGVH